MREKASREVYDTCWLRETLEDFARFLRTFNMYFNHVSVVPRDTRDDFFFKPLWHAYNSCNNSINNIIWFKICFSD